MEVCLKKAPTSTRNQGKNPRKAFSNVNPLFQGKQNVKSDRPTSFPATAPQENKGMGLSGQEGILAESHYKNL